jgi:hypothetical protein
MNLVVQLPEDPDEALRILDYARELIADWVEASSEPDRPSNLVRLSLLSGGLP